MKPPSCRDLGFALGPRINAGGRVGKSDLGVRLLTSTDPEEARDHRRRARPPERGAPRDRDAGAASRPRRRRAGQADAPVIIVMSRGWHQGVIGIVAGRLKERFGRPAIVIAETEDGTGKGSGRSISGVDLGAAVLAAKDSGLLIAGGGHAMAAGLTRRRRAGSSRSATSSTSGWPPTSRRRAATGRCCSTRCSRRAESPAACATRSTPAGPYGAGWPAPARRRRAGAADQAGIVGDGHVRGLACGDDGKSFKWIAFRSAATALGQALLASPADQRWWLAGTIKRDEWNGGNAAEMHLEDAALA